MTSRASDSLQAFAADAERLLDDPHAIGTRLGALLAYDGWLAPEHRVPSQESYRQHLLHVSPCRRLSIVALVWLPGQRTPIHDHVSWCVVGVYEGRERETRYRAIEVDGERLGSSIYRRFDDWPVVLSRPRAARTSAVSVAMS